MNGAKVVAALTRAIESSRPATAEADAAVAGAGVGADPARASRWFHTLVAVQNGGGDGCGEGFDPSGLAGSELKPQRLESYMACDDPQSKKRPPSHRVVTESAAACGCVLLGREECNSSPGPAGSAFTSITETGRAARIRILPPRHAVSVRGS